MVNATTSTPIKWYFAITIAAVAVALLTVSCGDNTSTRAVDTNPAAADTSTINQQPNINGIQSGIYDAVVTYFSPKTGASNTYTIQVEVDNNKLVKIYWLDSGWLNNERFAPTELDEEGFCSFTSESGCQYLVKIIGRDNGYTEQQILDIEDESDAIPADNIPRDQMLLLKGDETNDSPEE